MSELIWAVLSGLPSQMGATCDYTRQREMQSLRPGNTTAKANRGKAEGKARGKAEKLKGGSRLS